MSERKFCWIYKQKRTGRLFKVQRPHRRAGNPTYWALRGSVLIGYSRTDFYHEFKYVGKEVTK